MLRRWSCFLPLLAVLAACTKPSITVHIDPAAVTLVPSGTTQFHATVTGSSAGVWWSVKERTGGTIDANGKYSAPAVSGTFHVVATARADATKSDTATVTLSADGVLLTSTVPASPANNNSPMVKGSAAPQATVKLYGTTDCSGTALGSGEAGDDGTFAVTIHVMDDTTTVIHATATSPAGGVSTCSTSSVTYVEDSTPPAAPMLTSVLPGATGSDHSPRFLGTAEAGSVVNLFTDACEKTVAQGSAVDFASSGLAVPVADGQSITVHATATDAAGNVSSCSTTSLSYTQVPDNGGGGTDGGMMMGGGGGWQGPTARLEFVPGSNETFINVDGQRYRPVFVSVNPQAITDPNTGWQTLLDEIDLASSEGMPVIDLMLANRTVSFIQELAQRLGSRQVYLWLRFDMWIPELANVGVPLMESLDGTTQPGYRLAHAVSRDRVWSTIPFYSTLDQSWLDAEKQSLTTLLNDLNQSGPVSRIIGVRTTYMAGGEWFQPPLAFHDNTLDESPPNAWPWSNPDVFSVWDYSSSEQAMFTQWLTSVGANPGLAFPTPSDRINPRLGRSFIVGSDGSGQAAVLYHHFQSARVAQFQSELAKTAKEFTGSKALTMINNAYLFSLDYYNGSYHTAFADVLASPYIDAISAPYNYNTLGTRSPGFAFIPHGPMDSPGLHGKYWIHEDDSRPYWSTDGFRTTNSFAEDLAIGLRNAVTSLIHGNALYYFDLPNQGWYGGNPAHTDEIRSLYQQVQHVTSQLSGQLSNSGPVQPQIAVFIDDDSYHLFPEFGMDGANSYGTSNDLILHMVEKISGAGAPVRYYLLDDLANVDVSTFKLVFFLNTAKLTQADRQQIQSKLMKDGRVLYFQHVAGLFDESLMPSWSLAAPFSPGVSSLSDIENSTSTAVTMSNQGDYTIAYSPRGADQAGVNTLLDQAGVHRYASNAIIDGAGNVLMVHATGGTVSVNLPWTAHVVDMLTGAELCASCTAVNLNLAGPETHVLQVTQPSGQPGKGRLFRYEFVPGHIGGSITYDERTYCSLPDGATLQACGFTFEDYINAPIVLNGQLTLSPSGSCMCP